MNETFNNNNNKNTIAIFIFFYLKKEKIHRKHVINLFQTININIYNQKSNYNPAKNFKITLTEICLKNDSFNFN